MDDERYRIYWGEWDAYEDMCDAFYLTPEQRPPPDNVLLAVYEYRDYDGSAFVLYVGSNGKLYEINASHCSCNGLENQWEPEETTLASLVMRTMLDNNVRLEYLQELATQIQTQEET